MAAIDESVGDLHLATVVTNVQDMNRAVDFWPAAAGYVRRERDRDPEFMVVRHEALLSRTEVEDLCLLAVAAVG
jgi:hypothetical protein